MYLLLYIFNQHLLCFNTRNWSREQFVSWFTHRFNFILAWLLSAKRLENVPNVWETKRFTNKVHSLGNRLPRTCRDVFWRWLFVGGSRWEPKVPPGPNIRAWEKARRRSVFQHVRCVRKWSALRRRSSFWVAWAAREVAFRVLPSVVFPFDSSLSYVFEVSAKENWDENGSKLKAVATHFFRRFSHGDVFTFSLTLFTFGVLFRVVISVLALLSTRLFVQDRLRQLFRPNRIGLLGRWCR